MKDNKIVLFSKTFCTYSDKLKDLLDIDGGLRGKYRIVEIDLEPKGKLLKKEIAAKYGYDSIPSLIINGEIIRGYNNA